ncbi:MAG: glycosyltransferase family 8 protein [Desulfosporosinus sp.]|jgi:lipopolysaccharide biosynthesis glycosyltransferase
MNILVTLDSNYIQPLRVMLKSLFLNNPDEKCIIYLMHASLSEKELAQLADYIEAHGCRLEIIKVEENCFAEAPILLHYTKEMYYRLLAYQLLPQDLDRILYLDPDILVINSIRELYDTDLNGYLYAAANHDRVSIKGINKIRLHPYEINAYYNSGVLLMNLAQLRQDADEQEIYRFVEENRAKLIMPDQDILNALYAKQIRTLDEKQYNYDARFYNYYKIVSGGTYDMDQVINHTSILHFCGKKKPWQKKYSGRFHALYKHYEKLANT